LFCLTSLVKYPEPKYHSSLLCVANVRLELSGTGTIGSLQPAPRSPRFFFHYFITQVLA